MKNKNELTNEAHKSEGIWSFLYQKTRMNSLTIVQYKKIDHFRLFIIIETPLLIFAVYLLTLMILLRL